MRTKKQKLTPEALKKLGAEFTKKDLRNGKCIDDEECFLFVCEALDDREMEGIESHLSLCSNCLEKTSQLLLSTEKVNDQRAVMLCSLNRARISGEQKLLEMSNDASKPAWVRKRAKEWLDADYPDKEKPLLHIEIIASDAHEWNRLAAKLDNLLKKILPLKTEFKTTGLAFEGARDSEKVEEQVELLEVDLGTWASIDEISKVLDELLERGVQFDVINPVSGKRSSILPGDTRKTILKKLKGLK
jgi:hypothetical protein